MSEESRIFEVRYMGFGISRFSILQRGLSVTSTKLQLTFSGLLRKDQHRATFIKELEGKVYTPPSHHFCC